MSSVLKIARVGDCVPYMHNMGNNTYARNYSGHFNPSNPSYYDSRKYSHHLPKSTVMPPFEPLANIPTGIFRDTSGEALGKVGANKHGMYKNPEYFSFHHMTFHDMNILLKPCRLPSSKTGRKP